MGLALRHMHEKGVGAEVISPYELWLAMQLGVDPSDIIYNGPGKTEESVRLLPLAAELKAMLIEMREIMPYSKTLETAALPSRDDVVTAIRQTLAAVGHPVVVGEVDVLPGIERHRHRSCPSPGGLLTITAIRAPNSWRVTAPRAQFRPGFRTARIARVDRFPGPPRREPAVH